MDLVQAQVVDAEHGQAVVGGDLVDRAVASNLGVIAQTIRRRR